MRVRMGNVRIDSYRGATRIDESFNRAESCRCREPEKHIVFLAIMTYALPTASDNAL